MPTCPRPKHTWLYQPLSRLVTRPAAAGSCRRRLEPTAAAAGTGGDRLRQVRPGPAPPGPVRRTSQAGRYNLARSAGLHNHYTQAAEGDRARRPGRGFPARGAPAAAGGGLTRKLRPGRQIMPDGPSRARRGGQRLRLVTGGPSSMTVTMTRDT